MKLDKRQDLLGECVTRKEAEVLALTDDLPRIARAPTKPTQGVALTEQRRTEIRERNAALRAWREKRRIFMAIKGGTASHSSDQ
jgi:hypothetical protein